METQQVEMTPEEIREYEAFKAERERKRREEQRKQQREQYGEMVDAEVTKAIADLSALSGRIREIKEQVYRNFDTVLELKADILGLKADTQRSHTFTTSDSRYRLTLGVNTIDGYRDTVEDGIAMVREYIESLAKDEQTRALVNAVMRLLSRDAQGNIKASRVLQLRRMAEESGNDRFIEGVRIIEESYQPTVTKRYIRAERRNDKGAWVYIPLSMTDVDD
nr:MAG TPA: Protein of unknown function (DUF3164) [Caudoviricetes sp.]